MDTFIDISVLFLRPFFLSRLGLYAIENDSKIANEKKKNIVHIFVLSIAQNVMRADVIFVLYIYEHNGVFFFLPEK